MPTVYGNKTLSNRHRRDIARRAFLHRLSQVEVLESRSLMAVVIGNGSASITLNEGIGAAVSEFDAYFTGTKTRAEVLADTAPGNAPFTETPANPGTITLSDPIRPFGVAPLKDAGGTEPGAPGASRSRQSNTLQIEDTGNVLGSWTTSNDAFAFVGNTTLGEQIAFTSMQRWTGPFTGSLVYGDFALRYTGSKLVLASNIDFPNAAYAEIGSPNISIVGDQLTISGNLLIGGGLNVLDPTSIPGTDFGDITITATLSEPPTVSNVADQSTNEDVPAVIPFTVGDVETAPSALTVTATSSNTTLIPNGNIVLGGAGANRTVTLTPAVNLSGTSTITLTVTDAAGVVTSDTFVLTVNPVNDKPTISDVVAQAIDEDTATGAIAFTVGDVETAAGSLTVTATSSNTTLVPNANIVLGGSDANRTVTVTPAANQNGTTTITLTVTDANGSSASDTFTLAVNPVFDPPVVVGNGSASITLTEGLAAAIGEFDAYFNALKTRGEVLADASPGNAPFTETPADPSTGTITLADPIRPFGVIPLGDTGGGGSRTRQATTLQIEDVSSVLSSWSASNDAGAFVGSATLGEQIALTSIQRWTGPFTGSLVFGDFGLRYTGSKLILTSNIDFANAAFAEIGSPSVSVSGDTLTISGNLLIGGALALLDPSAVPGTDFGDITITALLTTPPTVTNVADQATNEDTQTASIPFTIGDAETAAGSLIVSATSSNTSLVPNGSIVVGGSGANRTVTLAPAANQSGTTTITLSVIDAAGVAATDTFVLTVNSANDSPAITDVANQATDEDTPTGAIAFTVGDVETPAGGLTVSATSSNTALVPNAGIVLGGSGANRTIALSPVANQHGTTTITLTVTDAGGQSATDTFLLTVNPVYDPPVAVGAGNASITLSEGFATALAEFEAYFNAGKTRAEALSDAAPGNAPFTEIPADPATGTVTLADPIRPFGQLPLNDAGGTTPGAPGSSRTRQATTLQIEDVSNVLRTWSTSNDSLAFVGDTTLGEQIAFTGMQRWTNPFTGAVLFGDFGLRYTGTQLIITSNIDFLHAAFAEIGSPIISVSGDTLTISGDLLIGNGLSALDPSAIPGTDFGDITITATLSQIPTVTEVADQATNEDTVTGVIAFTVGDAETAASNLVVTASSSNTSLVPNVNILLGGSGANRTVTLTPTANQSGTTTITLSVIDVAGVTVNESFVLTVNAVNDPPTISNVTDQTTNESTATGAIAFTIGDLETVASNLVVTASSSNTTLVPNANILIGGSGANRTVILTPVANQHGTTTITLTVTDSNGELTSDTFVLTVVDNVAPSVVSINRANINPTNAGTVSYTVTFGEPVSGVDAADFALATSGVTGASIISVAPIGSGTVLPNTIANGTTYLTYNRAAWATVAPYANFFDIHGNDLGYGAASADADGFRWMFPDRFEGATWIAAAYPSDFLTPLPDHPLSQPTGGFAMAVNTYGVNNFAANHKISDYNSTTNPNGYIGLAGSLRATSDFNQPGASVWWEHLAVRQDPVDSIWKIYATSGPGQGSLFELRNVSAETINGNLHLSGDYVFGNTDWLQFFQDANGHLDTELVLGHIDLIPSGSTTYSVSIDTGTGDGTISLNMVDDDSILDTAGNQLGSSGSGNGNFAGQTYAIDKSAPTVSINQANLQSDPATAAPILFTVVFNEPVAGFDPSDIDFSGSTTSGTLVAILSGTGPTYTISVSGMTGSGVVVASVKPGAAQDAANNFSAASTSTDNSVTINNAPTISNIADLSTNEDTATGAIAFTVGDVETAAASLTVSATSSNTTLVPNANIVFGGSGANRSLTLTPAANQFGTTTITITVTDAGGLTATDTIVLTVSAVNDSPTVSNVADLATNEDTATASIGFTIGDVETAAGTLIVTSTSSNTTLVPNANIVLGGSGVNRTVTLTPAANQSGTTTITITVTDAGGLTATDTFVLTVNPVNDAPTISNVADLATNEDTAAAAIPYTIGDLETGAGLLTVTATSSNTALVPNANIVLGGSGASRTVTLSPAANQSGTTTITLTVTDGGLTSTDTFVLTVNPVDDAPTLDAIGNPTPVAPNSGQQTISLSGISAGGGESQTLTITAVSSNPALIPNPSVSYASPGSTGSLTFTPAAGQTGTATITVTVTDDGGTANGGLNTTTRTFTVTVQTPSTLDFGDAPNSYGTLLANNGPRHTVGPLFLGSSVTAEADGQPGTTATGDVDNGVGFPSGVLAGMTTTYTVTASQAGKLDAWIDFNRNGLFDANEKIADSIAVVAGSNSLRFNTPLSANGGDSYARFRLSTAGGLSPLGAAVDGEVEDYAIRIVSPNQPGAFVIPDPENPTRGLLVINGTAGIDVIRVVAAGGVTGRTIVVAPMTSSLLLLNSSTFDRVLIRGGGGVDLILFSPDFNKPATIYGDAGVDVIYGGAGNDTIYGGAGIDTIRGGGGDDQIFGDGDIDFLYGDAGNDLLQGGDGGDYLYGGAGADVLIGGNGTDFLYGDAGDDILIGGKWKYDSDPTTLAAILLTWGSSSTFSSRVSALSSRLNSSSLSDDGTFDYIWTGTGRDWVHDAALRDLLLDFNYNTTNGDKRN